MEYTVQKLAAMAGVSGRTLRYYDQIGLLRPARISTSGYRIYGHQEVDALQQILLYREMGVPLEEIREILADPGFDRLTALRRHQERLLEKQAQIGTLIETVAKTIAATEAKGGIAMSDKEKFRGMKEALIEENERKYGAEIREKYGAETVDASNARLMNLSEEEYREMGEQEQKVLRLLDEAFQTGDPTGEAAKKLVEAHKKWLNYTWSEYSAAAHCGLAEMYAADERFAAYYDRGEPGKAVFLRDCIVAQLGE